MDDIWSFVEAKLNTPIPAYFKSVLNVCGYNNGISISFIEDEDLKYMENEVRNGNVGNSLNGAHGGVHDFLEGCTKTEENFEFVLGHKKFLLAIANFLRKYIADNGVDSLTLNENQSKNKKNPNRISVLSSLNVDELVPLVTNTMKIVKLDSDSLNVDLNRDYLSTTKANPVIGQSPIDDSFLEIGSYVIYRMSLKSWACWPNVEPPVKYFVGQVLLLEGLHGKKFDSEACSEVKVIELRQSPYKIHNFSFPEKCEPQKISKKNILEILENPVKNRRGELVFEDKSLSRYIFN